MAGRRTSISDRKRTLRSCRRKRASSSWPKAWVLTLKYKDGEKKIPVPADTPIVVYVPGEKNELKPGAPIFIAAATKQPDGTLLTPRVNVGRGVAPPM
jgi:hypothetical protein